MTVNGAWSLLTCCNGMWVPVSQFSRFCAWSTEWRWLNVPRPLSSPDNRMGYPLASKEAKAIASPMPQSTLTSPRPMAARSVYTFCTSGWTLNSAGRLTNLSARRFHSVNGIAVSALSVHFLFKNGDQSTANLPLKLLKTGSRVCLPSSIAARYALTISSPAPGAITPCASSRSAYSLRVPGCCAMMLYIRGWVIAGVSCSLWPSFLKQIISTATSFLNWVRYSKTSWVAKTTASGSSPFTCKTGESMVFMISVQ